MTLLWLGMLGLSSCAYRISGSTADIPGISPETKAPYRIFIPIADNKTSNVGMESELPEALVRAISGMTNVSVVSREDDANLLLAPRVKKLDRTSGLGTLQGTQETSNAGGLAIGAVTAREFKVLAEVQLDLFERSPLGPTGTPWIKRWTRSFTTQGSYDSSLRLIPSKGSSSSTIINHSRERLLLRTLSEDVARQVREQVFQGF